MARGVEYLLSTQRDDGTWDEPEFTGTGFPQVFYLRYHYYPIYFPLLALSHWAAARASRRSRTSAAHEAWHALSDRFTDHHATRRRRRDAFSVLADSHDGRATCSRRSSPAKRSFRWC